MAGSQPAEQKEKTFEIVQQPKQAAEVLPSELYIPEYDITVKTDYSDPFVVRYLAGRSGMNIPRENWFGMENLGESREKIANGIINQTARGGAAAVAGGAMALYRAGKGLASSAIDMGKRDWELFRLEQEQTGELVRLQQLRTEGKISESDYMREKGRLEDRFVIKSKAVHDKFLEADRISAEQIKKLKESNEVWLKSTGLAKTGRDGFVYDLAGGMASLAGSIALAALFKSPAAAGVAFGAITGREDYEEALENGKSRETAAYLGFWTGAASMFLEKYGVETIMRPLKNAGIIKYAVRSVITEGSEELMQNLADDGIMTMWGGREKEISAIVEEAILAGVIGGITGGFAGGVRGGFAVYDDTKIQAKEMSDLRRVLNFKAAERATEGIPEFSETARTIPAPPVPGEQKPNVKAENGQQPVSAGTAEEPQPQKENTAEAATPEEAGNVNNGAFYVKMAYDRAVNDLVSKCGMTQKAAETYIDRAMAQAADVVGNKIPQILEHELDDATLEGQADEIAAEFRKTVENLGKDRPLSAQFRTELDGIEKKAKEYAEAQGINGKRAELYGLLYRQQVSMWHSITGMSPEYIAERFPVVLQNYNSGANETAEGTAAGKSPEAGTEENKQGRTLNQPPYNETGSFGKTIKQFFGVSGRTDAEIYADIHGKIRNPKVANNTRISLGYVPDIYVALGLIKDKDLKASKLTFRKAYGLITQAELIANKDLHNHNVPDDVIKKIGSLIADPLLIMDSKKHPGRIMAVVQDFVVDKKTNAVIPPIVIIISPSKRGHGYSFVPTAYDKNNLINLISWADSKKKIYYISDKKIALNRIAYGNKSQLPSMLHGLSQSTLLSNSIPSKEDIVKRFGLTGNNGTSLYQTAYAGSRTDYDRPALEAIGTGEGNQVHGWGLYYALNRDVAEGYRERSYSKYKRTYIQSLDQEFNELRANGKPFLEVYDVDVSRDLMETLLHKPYGVIEKELENRINRWQDRLNDKEYQFKDYAKGKIEAYTKLKNDLHEYGTALIKQDTGQVHEVDIPENPYLIDEDLPINEQSEIVRRAVRSIMNDYPDNYDYSENYDAGSFGSLNGREFYKELMFIAQRNGTDDRTEQKKYASRTLEKYGIKGIAYDGRRDGPCVVIFNPDDVKVIQKFYQDIAGAAQGGIDGSGPRGATTAWPGDPRLLIELFRSADDSTLPHELAHVFMLNLQRMRALDPDGRVGTMLNDLNEAVGEPAGEMPGTYSEAQQEKFARMFERYLAEGNAPNKKLKRIFVAFKEWLRDIYRTFKGWPELSPAAKRLFDKWLTFDDVANIPGTEALKEYREKTNALKEVAEAAKESRDTESDGITVHDVKAVLNVTRMARPEEPEAVKAYNETLAIADSITESQAEAENILDSIEDMEYNGARQPDERDLALIDKAIEQIEAIAAGKDPAEFGHYEVYPGRNGNEGQSFHQSGKEDANRFILPEALGRANERIEPVAIKRHFADRKESREISIDDVTKVLLSSVEKNDNGFNVLRHSSGLTVTLSNNAIGEMFHNTSKRNNLNIGGIVGKEVIANLPSVFKNSVFIAETPDLKRHTKNSFLYFGNVIKSGNDSFIVKITVKKLDNKRAFLTAIELERNAGIDLSAYDVKVTNKKTLAGNMSVHSKSTAFRKGTDYIVADLIDFIKFDLEKYLNKNASGSQTLYQLAKAEDLGTDDKGNRQVSLNGVVFKNTPRHDISASEMGNYSAWGRSPRAGKAYADGLVDEYSVDYEIERLFPNTSAEQRKYIKQLAYSEYHHSDISEREDKKLKFYDLTGRRFFDSEGNFINPIDYANRKIEEAKAEKQREQERQRKLQELSERNTPDYIAVPSENLVKEFTGDYEINGKVVKGLLFKRCREPYASYFNIYKDGKLIKRRVGIWRGAYNGITNLKFPEKYARIAETIIENEKYNQEETKKKLTEIYSENKDVADFVRQLKLKGYETSKSGNLYVSVEKPLSNDVKEGTRRLAQTIYGHILQEFSDGSWNDIAEVESYPLNYHLEDILTEKKKRNNGTTFYQSVAGGEQPSLPTIKGTAGEFRREDYAWAFRKDGDTKNAIGNAYAIAKINSVIKSLINELQKRKIDPETKERIKRTLRSAIGYKGYLTRVRQARSLVDEAINKTRGFDIFPRTEKKPVLTEEKAAETIQVRYDPEKQAEIDRRAGAQTEWEEFKGNIKNTLTKVGRSVSDRAGKISPRLKLAFRDFARSFNMQRTAHVKAIEPFLKAYHAMEDNDKPIFDWAAFNGDTETIESLKKKYENLAPALETYRNVLNEIYVQAAEAGFEVGYIQDYFPRKVKNPEALITLIKNTDEWTYIERWLKQQLKVNDPDGWINAREHQEVIADMISTVFGGQGGTGKPGNIKKRRIFEVTPKMMRYYYDSAEAAVMYAAEMDRAIQARKFFGYDLQHEEESISMVIADIIEDRKAAKAKDPNVKLLTQKEADELFRNIQSVMHPIGPDSYGRSIKTWGYMFTLVSPISTITQLEDLSVSFAENGIGRTLESATGKKITLEDIGVEIYDPDINSLTGINKYLNTGLKVTGFSKMDRFGKETFILSDFKKRTEQVKKDRKGFIEECEMYGYEAGRIKNMIAAFEKGDANALNDDAKSLLFYDLAEVQPIDMAEMPEMYLRGGNWRIAYALKTFTLKRLNYLIEKSRRYAVQGRKLWDKGDKNAAMEEWIKGIRTMTWTMFLLVTAGASMDWLKDLIMGRQTDIPSVVVDNILKQASFNRWEVKRVAQEGFMDVIVAKTYPVMGVMLQDILTDSQRIYKGSLEMKDMRIWNNIPIVGRFYYWWFGGGKLLTEKQKEKEARKNRTGNRRRKERKDR